MRILITVILLTFFLGITKGQSQNSNYISIDHIPIVVRNLDYLKKELSESFHFKVKEGREHEGIINCFIKFQDGTYLEFITPIDSSQTIGKYYADFLKNRPGGTSLAISIKSSDALIDYLNTKSISYKIDSNRIWKTIEPKNNDIFFIEYSNNQWKDSKINTTHLNTAISLKSIYILSSNITLDVKKYEAFGFVEIKKSSFFKIPIRHLVMGPSNLYLLDASKSKNIRQSFNKENLKGICGFEIKTKSLHTFNMLLEKTDKVTVEKNQTIIYLQDLSLFFVFTE